MDRTQKKCVVASTGIHVLLALILVVGPAFVSSKSKVDDLPLLDFVPVKTVDALMSGGGYRDGQPPAAAPAPQAPPPQPQPKPAEKQPDPEPPKPAPKEEPKPKEDSASLVPSAKPKHKVEINTNLITRKPDASSAKARAKAKAEAKAREEAREWSRQLARQLGKTAQRIGDQASGTTSIRLLGPGGGGVPYANFLQAVKTVYANAWVVPDGMTDDRAVAVVSVTIAKDGHVLRHEIVRHSGNSLVDQSVQATLERVKFAAPLPDDAKESERTVTINFDVRAKQGIG